ncbi:MAG: rod shape-determining protein RodA [Saprospiraceae bacterium]|nr:rod shape-determining protein RodA [Saprospiraceae bacterium]
MLGSIRKINFDWITFGIYLSLLTIGWFSIYSATSSFHEEVDFLNSSIPIVKQSIYLIIALVVFTLVQFIDWRFWHTFAYIFYGISLILLMLVPFLGEEINGASAWFYIGGFSFQPSEFTKFSCSLAVCSFLTYFKGNIKSPNNQWILVGIIFLPVLLIMLQPDAGSALTFLSLFILLYIEGFNPIYYIIGFLFLATFICSIIFPLPYILIAILILSILLSWYYIKSFKYQWILLFILIAGILYLFIKTGQVYGFGLSIICIMISIFLLWRNRNERLAFFVPLSMIVLSIFAYSSISVFNGLKEHQQERIKVWLKPSECDPRGSLYNILQSKVAIGSGGFFGKGFLSGNMTRLKYVPEQSTDFIFSTIGEEQGFIGCVIVILLFAFLIYRLLIFAENVQNKFMANYAVALAGFLIVHMIINIGMTLGIVPIIGIPLPFISKGGSSLIIFSMMMGLYMRFYSRPQ